MSHYVHCYELFTIINGMFCDWSLNMFAATHDCRDVGIQILKFISQVRSWCHTVEETTLSLAQILKQTSIQNKFQEVLGTLRISYLSGTNLIEGWQRNPPRGGKA